MTRAWPLILLVLLMPVSALSDSSDLEGGVFIAHHPPGLQYSAMEDYCQRYFQDFAVDSCSEQNNRIDLDGNQGQTSVWYVLAAWGEEKEWCGAEFGFAAYDSTIYLFQQWGPCPASALSIPTPGWPGPNRGVAISLPDTTWSGNFLPIYWFGGYAYYEGEIPLAVNPSSEFGGTANCEMPPQAWAAASFGAMGIFEDGVSACPEGLVDGGGFDGGTQPDGYGGYEPEEDDQEFGEPEWIDLGGDPNNPLVIHLVESDGSTSVLELTIGGFYRTPVPIGDSTYYAISLGREPVTADSCLPALPHVARSLIIPDDQRMVCSIDSSAYSDLGSMPVVPSKGLLPMTVDPDTVSYCFDSVYTSNALYPAEVVHLCSPYVLRDFRGLVADLRPIQVRPASDSLRVYTHLLIRVSAAGTDTTNVLTRGSPTASIARQFALLYEDHFLNYHAIRALRSLPVAENDGLLIIAGEEFSGAALDSFVQWKTQRGDRVQLRLLGGEEPRDDPLYIKGIVYEAYAGPDNTSHVLLVGDEPQMPTFLARIDYDPWDHYHSAADPLYTLLSGLDSYPEVFVGRISGWDLSDVETQFRRTTEYEQDLRPSESWLGDGVGIDYWPDLFGWLMDAVSDRLLAYTYSQIDRIDSPDPEWVEHLRAAFNDGRGIVNYIGHGAWNSWAFDDGDTTAPNSRFKVDEALTNDGRLPFIMSCACRSGDWIYPGPYEDPDPDIVCFAEQMLRVTGPTGEPRGAIAALMSSSSQKADVVVWAMLKEAELLTGEEALTVGGLWYNSECAMLDRWMGTSDERAAEQLFSTWTLFGDPSLAIRTKAPEEMEVTHVGGVRAGQSTYEVRASCGGGPIGGARCAVSGHGEPSEILYGAAATGDDGVAEVVLSPTPQWPQSLTLTVTARNRVTYIGAIRPMVTVRPQGGGDYTTIQDGVTACPDGGMVQLDDGTYEGEENYGIDCGAKSVAIVSEGGDAASCVIDCDGHWGLWLDERVELPNTLILRGITIRNASGSIGAAVRCQGDLEATDCVFSDNSAQHGGAVYCDKTAELSGCLFSGNTASQEGGGVMGACPFGISLHGCTFVGNVAAEGGGLWSTGGELAVVNCTFAENAAESGAGSTCRTRSRARSRIRSSPRPHPETQFTVPAPGSQS